MPEHLGCFAKCLFVLDKHILKPILVYKYSIERVERDEEFFDKFEGHADELRDIVHMDGISETHSARIIKLRREERLSEDGNVNRS